jgi:hypothetical protein
VAAPSGVPVIHTPAAATVRDAPAITTSKRRWYGWQTLTADAASITLIAAGVSSRSDMAAFTGIASLAVTPSIVHLAHGNYGAAGGSLAMRVAGVPLAAGAGYAIGRAACSPASEDKDVPCSALTADFTMLGAALFAVVLDSAILGYDSGSNDHEKLIERPRRAAALHIVPSLSLSRERSVVTLSGDF